MKILVKPLVLIDRPYIDVSALEALVTYPKAPRETLVERAYQQLVTGQGVHPDRAKRLLGLP